MPFPEDIRKAVGKKRGWVCWNCGRKWSDGWLMEVDHIVPSSEGGADTVENGQVLCIECHLKKHEKSGHPASPHIIRARLEKTKGRWK